MTSTGRLPIGLPLIACAIGLCLLAAPKDLADRARATLRDACAPGLRLASLMLGQPRQDTQSTPPAEGDTASQQTVGSELARWQLEAVRLKTELERVRREAGGLAAAPSEPLVTADLVQARVLGREASGLWRARQLLDQGQAVGVMERAVVLRDDRPLIDVGQDGDLAPGFPVFAGRVVVGKIAAAGRWSSTLKPITDREFQGGARLARITSQGLRLGGEGTLHGLGEATCQLRRLLPREPVQVGDLVVTATTDGVAGYPLLYGTVVEAELLEGALEWSIRVAPAAQIDSVHQVQVLRLNVNPGRLLAD